MLNRSFFDVLCDLWYYPRFSLILKAIVTPFIISVEPENVIKQLDILRESDRKIFLSKGMVYIFPKIMKKLILPEGYNLHKKIHDFLDSENENQIIEHKNNSFLENEESFLSLNEKVEMLEETKDKNQKKRKHKNQQIRPNKVIISSKIVKTLNHCPGQISNKWDNLRLYKEDVNRRKSDLQKSLVLKENSILSKKNASDNSIQKNKEKSHNDVSPINVILNIIEMKKNRILMRFSQRTLATVFIISLLIFGVKLGVSQKYRKITKDILVLVSYGGVLGVGTLSFVALMMRANIKKKMKP